MVLSLCGSLSETRIRYAIRVGKINNLRSQRSRGSICRAGSILRVLNNREIKVLLLHYKRQDLRVARMSA